MAASKTRRWMWVGLWLLTLGLLSTTLFSSETSEKVLRHATRQFPEVAQEVKEETGLNRGQLHNTLRKGAHVVVYALLGGLLYRALLTLMPAPWAFVFTLILGMAAASADEIHQMTQPGRTGTFYDLRFDGPGLLLGTLLAAVIERFRKRARA